MPRIDYGDGLIIDASAGMTVLEASVQYGISHMHACGGLGQCTTCRVKILKGSDLHDESLVWLLPYQEVQKVGIRFAD